jgi:alpha-glucuronidase
MKTHATPPTGFCQPLLALLISLLFQPLLCAAATADDGHRLWLRYDPLPAELAATHRTQLAALVAPGVSATMDAIRKELGMAIPGLLGRAIPDAKQVAAGGALVIGTPANNRLIAGLALDEALGDLGPDGFIIRSVKISGHDATVIASATETGALYGTFHFLRLLQSGHPVKSLDVTESPRFRLRLLNHWDNLDGSIERGYAGTSLWKWKELPDTADQRLTDYARANASLGINGTVLNNVNANARSLTPDYLRKTAAIADVFRPYGLRVYLSARFSAPIEIGNLKTADPHDPEVAAWWKAKADEIYTIIPDFGGFLVKANSEGQPGPLTYKRTHADGANMLAAAVAPHGGVVMWRAFVYEPDLGSDRISQAYASLKPFDGKFAANVLLQVKNGPLDFMPREPFHQLFGGMPETQVMPELQITQEYLGHSKQLAFLAPMWREFFDADTHAKGPGSTVSKVVDGSLFGGKISAIAGVANTGSDRNWTGHLLAQANWYAYGRLAWNPDLTSKQVAEEWVRQTFPSDPATIAAIVRLLLESHEAVVDYSMPLGLHHLIWTGHHYGPQPWWDKERRADWNPVYFHRASTDGLGFDRTAKGSNALAQYHPGASDRFSNPATCPDEFLLWFHHVPWDHKMHSGRTLWDELGFRYQRGVDWTRAANKTWASLSGKIDAGRHAAVAAKLAIQEQDAVWWRDACLLYFQTFSKLPIPDGVDKPTHTLAEVMANDPIKRDPGNHASSKPPLVYRDEHTGAGFPPPPLPAKADLPVIEPLTDPFMWSSGGGRVSRFDEWSRRRAEIKAEIEHYEIGRKPDRPQDINARYENGTLTVNVTVNGQTLTLTSEVTLPSGGGPFPAIIGIGRGSGSLPADIFTSRDVALITYHFEQVMAHTQKRGQEPINRLYPELIHMGAYSAWSWGVSRLIDGLELVRKDLPVDLSRLAVSGCSFAGKMALFAGAFDERIALTIAQEPGGGGAAAWRVSETLGKVETLGATSRAWFKEDMFQFSGADVGRLPMDHHELMAMVAPRALFVLGNPNYEWLADESGYVSCRAAHEVWKAFGIGDRFGFSILGGHGHCQLPEKQKPEVEAFVDKFLLGKTTVNTDITHSIYDEVDHSRWIEWWGSDKSVLRPAAGK